MKLEAKVLRMISVKKRTRNARSILESKKSEIPIRSAIVSQNKMNSVYTDMSIIEHVSKKVDSSIFRHCTFRRGIASSFLGVFITAGVRNSDSFTDKCMNLLTTTM